MGDDEGKYQPKAAMRGLFQHRHESCRDIGRTEYDAHDTPGWRRIGFSMAARLDEKKSIRHQSIVV